MTRDEIEAGTTRAVALEVADLQRTEQEWRSRVDALIAIGYGEYPMREIERLRRNGTLVPRDPHKDHYRPVGWHKRKTWRDEIPAAVADDAIREICAVVGCDPKELRDDPRYAPRDPRLIPLTLARAAFALAMRRKGYYQTAIGAVLQRDPSIISVSLSKRYPEARKVLERVRANRKARKGTGSPPDPRRTILGPFAPQQSAILKQPDGEMLREGGL